MNKQVQLTMSEEDAKILMTSVGMFSKKRLDSIYKSDKKIYPEAVINVIYGKDFDTEKAFDVTGAVYQSLGTYFDKGDPFSSVDGRVNITSI